MIKVFEDFFFFFFLIVLFLFTAGFILLAGMLITQKLNAIFFSVCPYFLIEGKKIFMPSRFPSIILSLFTTGFMAMNCNSLV